MRQPDPLGAAGGAGGVDEGGELVLRDGPDPLLDQVRVLLQIRGTALFQLGEGEHPVAGLDTGRVDDHDMGEFGQLGALLLRLGELGRVLGDQHLAGGVGEDEGRLVGVGLRIHRGRGGAGAHDAEVAEDPLDAGGGGERDALLRLYAQFDEPGSDGVHAFGGLRPGQRLPVVGALTGGRGHRVTVGLGFRRGGHAIQEKTRHGRRTVLDQGLCVAHDILRGPRQCGGWLICGLV